MQITLLRGNPIEPRVTRVFCANCVCEKISIIECQFVWILFLGTKQKNSSESSFDCVDDENKQSSRNSSEKWAEKKIQNRKNKYIACACCMDCVVHVGRRSVLVQCIYVSLFFHKIDLKKKNEKTTAIVANTDVYFWIRKADNSPCLPNSRLKRFCLCHWLARASRLHFCIHVFFNSQFRRIKSTYLFK